jgi:predicted amidophosphoribosyltransferase
MDLQAQGFVFAWDRTELAPGVTAWGLRPHAGIHRTLVHRLKYGAEARAAEALASLVLPLPDALSFPPDIVVTWVTMPESRRRNRAVDHGRLLAEAVARRLSLPCRQLLVRRDVRTKSQVTLSVSGRRANLKGAFEPLEAISFPVLLVDDVRTTGTTLARCADALRSGGAQQVTAITITRAHDGK